MSEIELMIRVSMLPPHLKEEVSDFVDFLLNKYVEQSQQNNSSQFGMMNGISDVFNNRLKEEGKLDE